jgi:hypothetical protein
MSPELAQACERVARTDRTKSLYHIFGYHIHVFGIFHSKIIIKTNHMLDAIIVIGLPKSNIVVVAYNMLTHSIIFNMNDGLCVIIPNFFRAIATLPTPVLMPSIAACCLFSNSGIDLSISTSTSLGYPNVITVSTVGSFWFFGLL